ncbi:Hydroxyacid oxidase 1 [Holothuria leucospilota]|uniref:(S)-2-hydroxy-acid oxidase n=1 Tax=Holothuria leucospilota TaxID=206669 RepID=A0A9Q1BIM6_HOLLE|nr:Hydroxyacid oxidase 1 [Holothuria leucospilota]
MSPVLCLDDFRELARKKKSDTPTLFSYYETGAGDEQTLEDSIAAFKRFRLIPRLLRLQPNLDLKTTVQGHTIRVPFGIAPTAIQVTAHPDGEKATAKAAGKFGTIMIVSSISQTPIEEIVEAAPDTHLWMQTYIFKNRRNTIDLVKRAERLGFKGIVVTVDSPVIGEFKRAGKQYEDYSEEYDKKYSKEEGTVPFEVKGVSLANFRAAPEEIAAARASGDEGLFAYAREKIQSPVNWTDVTRLATMTRLPIIVKGVITAEGAREAVAAGVQGIIVSAHGGRQLDGIQAPIEALPAIIDAVRGFDVEVYMDGGVRSGRDIFKALAIGAKAVFIGRPIIWGLIVNGAQGVLDVLEMLENELKNTMALCGCNKVSEVTRSFVQHESQLICRL